MLFYKELSGGLFQTSYSIKDSLLLFFWKHRLFFMLISAFVKCLFFNILYNNATKYVLISTDTNAENIKPKRFKTNMH